MITRYDNTTKIADVSVGGVTESDVRDALEDSLVLLESASETNVPAIQCNLTGPFKEKDFYYIQFSAETTGSGRGYIGLQPTAGSGNNCHWWGAAVENGQVRFLDVPDNPRFFDIAVDGTNQGITGWMKITACGPGTWWNYTYMISRADYGCRMGGGRLNLGPNSTSGRVNIRLRCDMTMGTCWLKIFGLKGGDGLLG